MWLFHAKNLCAIFFIKQQRIKNSKLDYNLVSEMSQESLGEIELDREPPINTWLEFVPKV